MGRLTKLSALFFSIILLLATVAQATTQIEEAQEPLGDIIVKNNNLLDTLDDINEELDWVLDGINEGIANAQNKNQFATFDSIHEAEAEKQLIEQVKVPEAEDLLEAIGEGEGEGDELSNLINIIENVGDFDSEKKDQILARLAQIAAKVDQIIIF